LYGSYKQANESGARIYWNDWGIGSVGIRPFIVYGVGRDQGLTSDIAKAILAGVAGAEYEISFGGQVALQYAPDVADVFIRSALSEHQGAAACNLRGDVLEVARFVDLLKEEVPGAKVTCQSEKTLPFPADLDDNGIRKIVVELPHTPLRSAIKETASRFERLLSDDLIDLGQLNQ
jgi:nucleoside-diphosphate-sugar epimerase